MRDGYFATGDIGYTDGKVIYVTGRKKNLIILSNGKNVPPEYLEDKINAIPYVKESLVVPRGKGERTKVLHALVVLSDDGKEENLTKDLQDINAKLPTYMRIDEWEIINEELKKNSSRKIIRKAYV